MPTDSGQFTGLIGRHTGTGDSNMYLAAVGNTGASFVASLWRNVGGVWTQLTSAPVNSGTGRLRFEIVGTSLKVDGRTENRIDLDRARRMVELTRIAREHHLERIADATL